LCLSRVGLDLVFTPHHAIDCSVTIRVEAMTQSVASEPLALWGNAPQYEFAEFSPDIDVCVAAIQSLSVERKFPDHTFAKISVTTLCRESKLNEARSVMKLKLLGAPDSVNLAMWTTANSVTGTVLKFTILCQVFGKDLKVSFKANKPVEALGKDGMWIPIHCDFHDAPSKRFAYGPAMMGLSLWNTNIDDYSHFPEWAGWNQISGMQATFVSALNEAVAAHKRAQPSPLASVVPSTPTFAAQSPSLRSNVDEQFADAIGRPTANLAGKYFAIIIVAEDSSPSPWVGTTKISRLKFACGGPDEPPSDATFIIDTKVFGDLFADDVGLNQPFMCRFQPDASRAYRIVDPIRVNTYLALGHSDPCPAAHARWIQIVRSSTARSVTNESFDDDDDADFAATLTHMNELANDAPSSARLFRVLSPDIAPVFASGELYLTLAFADAKGAFAMNQAGIPVDSRQRRFKSKPHGDYVPALESALAETQKLSRAEHPHRLVWAFGEGDSEGNLVCDFVSPISLGEVRGFTKNFHTFCGRDRMRRNLTAASQ
jgi:hypothetical protein